MVDRAAVFAVIGRMATATGGVAAGLDPTASVVRAASVVRKGIVVRTAIVARVTAAFVDEVRVAPAVPAALVVDVVSTVRGDPMALAAVDRIAMDVPQCTRWFVCSTATATG